MSQQTTHSIIMCRPDDFGYNDETGTDNEFQHRPETSAELIKQTALTEFEAAVAKLQKAGVEILELKQQSEHALPDAVFPNNWFTTTVDGKLITYPMKTLNRQREIAPNLLSELVTQAGYQQPEHIDFATPHTPLALEGTGVLVFDHPNRIVYAALSERCDGNVLAEYCQQYDWRSVSFQSTSSHQIPIYHTNVMMSVGSQFVVICLESIAADQRETVTRAIAESGKILIDISFKQMEEGFCGNILEVKNHQGEAVIAMSQTAWNHFTPSQQQQLQSYGTVVACPIPTIEFIGGGSLRCMMAENFLPKASSR
ncbi:arginine deiminase-related protein [Pleionea sp. CnH1-48]|uniref:arginine deiminase-related protein n=1 Tax=Pleionea sp. CnH1-48 TaxID=2954494 RepID=UPI002096F7D4|nr:arginine deiminase-related protein [Pleionea sp. CnH1-48]MCO7226785.1 arginine deiminase-related protein [Pleionea sp. CnH1-48]